jgi:hypothetical protein
MAGMPVGNISRTGFYRQSSFMDATGREKAGRLASSLFSSIGGRG